MIREEGNNWGRKTINNLLILVMSWCWFNPPTLNFSLRVAHTCSGK